MIKLNNISKKFKVYKDKRDRFKEWMTFGRKTLHSEFWALRDINLTIPKGEVFGLVGLNGAGKSTLLKIITGTMAPSSGEVILEGKVAALLELGTGFHEELTGRDNVRVNGRLLGMSEEEIHEKMDEIEQFCELGDYFDKPIRTYSTGMYVRLAFALATSVQPDVLIIDEALSVGDAYFQQKCVKRMELFKKRGTTILFVSHDLSMLKIFCDRIALLQKGKIESVGNARDILELYNAKLAEHEEGFSLQTDTNSQAEEVLSSGNGKVLISKVSINTPQNTNVSTLEAGQQCQIKIEVSFSSQVYDPTVGIMIRDRLGYDIFGTNTKLMSQKTGHYHKGDKADFNFNCMMNIGPGEYTLTVAIHQDSIHTAECYQWVDRILSFKVIPQTDFQFSGVSLVATEFCLERPQSSQH
ncbi:MAG: ABC transporter ATP-binding protein [Oligoflexales bacterium]|nr:ABC transporter ATP-binding protein [Oligoflexales bacterium]